MNDINDQQLVPRLEAFLSSWRAAGDTDEPSDRLRTFFSEFAALRPRTQATAGLRQVDPNRLASFFSAIREPLARKREAGGMLNPWSAARLGHNEVRNAAVLSTLWSPQICGDAGIRFLEAFCRQLHDPGGLLPTAAELREGYFVRREHCPLLDASERVDITIEGSSFVLGIEVKIRAGEGEAQLARYSSSVRRWGRQRGKRSMVVFLAPYSRGEDDVIEARWQHVVRAIRATYPVRQGDRTAQHYLFNSFADHLQSIMGTKA